MAESKSLIDLLNDGQDGMSRAYRTIELEHARIHEGYAFSFCKSTTALGASSYIDIQINCNSTVYYVHLKNIDINNSGGIAQVQLFEMVSSTASTWSNSTTAISVYNKNRNSTVANVFTVGYQPTLITSSCYTILRDYYVGSTGTVQARSMSQDNLDNETLLKRGSTYVWRITNLGTAGFSSIKAFTYEA